MKQLTEKRQELEAKQKVLAEVFEQAGPELDLDKVTKLGETDAQGVKLTTAKKAALIREKNLELTALGKEVEELVATAGVVADQKARQDLLEKANPAGGIVHPTPRKTTAGDNGMLVRAIRKSLGDLFVESIAFKQYNRAAQRSPAVEIDLSKLESGPVELKTLLTETLYAPQVIRESVILPGLLRRPVVADLIPQGTTSQTGIAFQEETTTTNAAASVAEGVAKPESALAFTPRTSKVEKIATVLPITDELMEDVPAMRAYVEARLRLFLQLAEETLLLTGDGNTPNILGLLNVVGINTQAKGADPTPDAVYKAMTKIRVNSFLEPSGAIFHPNDWQDIRLLRTADGIYIWGSPADPGPERIWGLPIVQTTGMTENTALVGAFDTGTMIFRRNQVSFAVSDQHSDFFVLNKLMLRVEERLALVCWRPKALATVTGI